MRSTPHRLCLLPCLRDQDQALEPDTVSAAVDIDRTIVQEVGTDMGAFAQPSTPEKMVDAKAHAATQVVEEPETHTAGTTYVSASMQHESYAMPTPSVSMNPRAQSSRWRRGMGPATMAMGTMVMGRYPTTACRPTRALPSTGWRCRT